MNIVLPAGIILAFAVVEPAYAQALDVTIYENAGDGEAASCGVGEVHGLKKNGDGFLAVRSGPGTKYRKIGEIYNGDRVTMIDYRGKWVGIARSSGSLNVDDLCANNGPRRALSGSALGWVHRNWVTYLYP